MNKHDFNALTQELLKKKMDQISEEQNSLFAKIEPLMEKSHNLHKHEHNLFQHLKQLQYEQKTKNKKVNWQKLMVAKNNSVTNAANETIHYHLHGSNVLFWVHAIQNQAVPGLNLYKYKPDQKQLIVNTLLDITTHLVKYTRTYNSNDVLVQYIRVIMPNTQPGQDYLAFHSNTWHLFRKGNQEVLEHSTNTLVDMIDYLLNIILPDKQRIDEMVTNRKQDFIKNHKPRTHSPIYKEYKTNS